MIFWYNVGRVDVTGQKPKAYWSNTYTAMVSGNHDLESKKSIIEITQTLDFLLSACIAKNSFEFVIFDDVPLRPVPEEMKSLN